MLSRKKKTIPKARKKVELKRIKDDDARYVTFSKRRSSVFGNASVISTLCGAEVLVLIYSPSGIPYTFGSPNVKLLMDRFLSGDIVHPVDSPSEQANQKAVMRNLNDEMMELSQRVDAMKSSNNLMLERTKTMIQGLDLDEEEEGMTFEKLTELNNKLVDFKEQLKSLCECSNSESYSIPYAGHEGCSSFYGMQTSDTYFEPDLGTIQQDLLNHQPTNSINIVDPFEPIQGPSDPFMLMNPTRGLTSSDPSALFQINWSKDKNLFEQEPSQSKPSSSSNSGSKLNNLF